MIRSKYFYLVDIQIGTQWQENLLDNLDNADDGVVIFSQEAIKSDWLIHEKRCS
jgi:hypothetical protein